MLHTCDADLAAAGAGLHAAVLGLRAAALTAPYDVPAWLPDVLLALAAAASAPPPTGMVCFVNVRLCIAPSCLLYMLANLVAAAFASTHNFQVQQEQFQLKSLGKTL